MDNFSKNSKENIRRILFAILAAGMMGLIFWFSSQGAYDSSEQSISVSYRVARIIRPGFKSLDAGEKEAFAESIEAIIRKCAHFLEFLLLGMLLLGSWSAEKRKFHRNALLALGTAALYAVSDEIHQSFVPGRSCEIRDMCIDTAGSLSGILLAALLCWLAKKLAGLIR